MRRIATFILVVLALAVASEAAAQKMPERALVRRGNRQFKRENYERSADLYQRALKCDSTSFEAKYDLASTLYRTERYEAAEKMLASIAQDTTRTDKELGEVAYNLGNTLFAQKKYKEALSSYRQAMRCNPTDEDAKFNYAFTKRLIQDEEQQQQNQDQNQDQNNKDKQNQDQNQDQNNKDKQNQDQNQENKDNKDNKQDNKEQQEQPQQQSGEQQGSMTPEQQEALLQAIQAEEDKTQEKLKEKSGVIVRGSKNW